MKLFYCFVTIFAFVGVMVAIVLISEPFIERAEERRNISLYSAWQKLHPDSTLTIQEFVLLRNHGLLKR